MATAPEAVASFPSLNPRHPQDLPGGGREGSPCRGRICGKPVTVPIDHNLLLSDLGFVSLGGEIAWRPGAAREKEGHWRVHMEDRWGLQLRGRLIRSSSHLLVSLAVVSEYAVQGKKDPGNATLYASLAEATFFIGLGKKNSDAVEMASYAPLFVNDMIAAVNLAIHATGLEVGVSVKGSRVIAMTSNNVMCGNSFVNPNNVVLVTRERGAGAEMQALFAPYSFTAFDLALEHY